METSENSALQCHHLASQPDEAWDELKLTKRYYSVIPHQFSTPVKGDTVRFVCISDTHSSKSLTKFEIPDGDVLLHAGDFTICGSRQEVQNFNSYLGTLPHRYKVVIAGNHEIGFDTPNLDRHPSQYLTNCIYLQDSSVNIYGLSIYGSPWQPEFGNWAFNLPRGLPCSKKWNNIPSDVDVLLTHTPPLGHGDLIYSGNHVGCVDLLVHVEEKIKPKYHVFGHIHEAYGCSTNGVTTFINCCSSNIRYELSNKPVVFEIPVPAALNSRKLLTISDT